MGYGTNCVPNPLCIDYEHGDGGINKDSLLTLCGTGVRMIGAITGDIDGAVYEAAAMKTTDFPLFSPGWRFPSARDILI